MTKREEAIFAISRAIMGRTCTAAAPEAFDAVVAVLMEPDATMIAAADEVAGTINPIDAFTLALKAAAQ